MVKRAEYYLKKNEFEMFKIMNNLSNEKISKLTGYASSTVASYSCGRKACSLDFIEAFLKVAKCKDRDKFFERKSN